MLLLPQLAVVFVGVAGANHDVNVQLDKMLREAHCEHATLSPADVRALTRHREGSRDIVKRLHADGVIGGELVGGHTLRIVIYRGDGGFKSLSESQMAGKVLATAELGVLKSNLVDEIQTLAPAGKVDPDEIEMEPTPAPARPVPAPASAPKRPVADDDDAPPGLPPAKATPAVAKIAPPPPKAPPPRPAPEPAHEAAPVETATAEDAVNASEIEAMMTGGGSEAPAPPTGESLHLRATAGLGIATRSFAPGPATVTGYDSSPVGSLQLGAEVAPTPRTALGVTFDHALAMTTPVSNGIAETSMTRWEVAGTYALVHGGSVTVAPALGFGHRSFSIHSTDPARSPDGDYQYLVLGAAASARVGERFTIRGTFALEPVVSGDEMTEAAFGEASRWAFAVGAAVEARVWPHVFVRAAADYQRFTWSWDGAGQRGAGGAVDAYPSGTLALGADY